jgi:hypothetical protein
MKKLIKVMNIIVYLVAIFFIIMSLDAYSITNTLWQNIGAFLIHASIGIVLLLINLVFRKMNLVLGLALVALAVFAFFFFEMYINFSDKILILLIVFIPLLLSGIIHIIFYKKFIKNNQKTS